MYPGRQSYQDPFVGHSAEFQSELPSHQQAASKYGQPQSQPPVGYTYETLQTPATSSQVPSAGTNSNTVSMATSPTTPRTRDYITGGADATMEEADPYNRTKYSSKHQSRPSSQLLNHAEESSAARRYSPGNVVSPPMSYPPSPGKQGQYGFTPQSASSRRSPSKPEYASPPQGGFQSPTCKLETAHFLPLSC